MFLRIVFFCGVALVLSMVMVPTSATATVTLPAVYPLVNIILPMLTNIYNLLESLFAVLETLPPVLIKTLDLDVACLKSSLLKLYSQALDLVNFLRGLPEYCQSVEKKTPTGLVGLLNQLLAKLTLLTPEFCAPIGGGLLTGLIQIVLCALETLLTLLI